MTACIEVLFACLKILYLSAFAYNHYKDFNTVSEQNYFALKCSVSILHC